LRLLKVADLDAAIEAGSPTRTDTPVGEG